MAEKKTKVLTVGITGWLGNLVAHALLDQGNAAVKRACSTGSHNAGKEQEAVVSHVPLMFADGA